MSFKFQKCQVFVELLGPQQKWSAGLMILFYYYFCLTFKIFVYFPLLRNASISHSCRFWSLGRNPDSKAEQGVLQPGRWVMKGKDQLLHSLLWTKMKKKTKAKHLLSFCSCWGWDLCRARRPQTGCLVVLGEVGRCLEQQRIGYY